MTILVERTAQAGIRDPRDLVSPDLFDRLTARIAADEHVSTEYAGRVMGQALIFLAACAARPRTILSPTKAVDVGWHAFVLHTADYAEFCERVAGEFIHHNPICTDDIRSGAALSRTLEALKATAYEIDEELWAVDPADCNQCHATCYDSP